MKSRNPLKIETDFSKKLAQDSAINLAIQIGNEASTLPVFQDKILTKLEFVKILLPIKKDEALGFLESGGARRLIRYKGRIEKQKRHNGKK